LLKERKGSYVLAIASYNTASRNVDKWINRFGDPREMKDFRKVIDWLELIPFSETRNYVQRVLEATQVYRLILNNDSKLKLVNDLMRKI
jgi:soluble lytic murein transglycosylase